MSRLSIMWHIIIIIIIKREKNCGGGKNNDFQQTIKYSVVENEFCVKSVAVCGERTKEAPKECSVYKIK